jgi:hypothetical protein
MCGYCCRVGPCAYGEWDAERGCCRLLTDDLCPRHDEIVELERGSRFPMFGSGCSSTLFNERRERKLAALAYNGDESS